MIGIGPPDAFESAQPTTSEVLAGPTARVEPDSARPRRRVVWFDDPDGAYLAAAALNRYLEATVVIDVILIPTERGPALLVPADAAKVGVFKAIVARFGGRFGPAE